MEELTIHRIIVAMTAQVDDRPNTAVLRKIRDRIDTRAFAKEIVEHARGLNHPEQLDLFHDDLKALRRHVEERRAALDYDRTQLSLIGIGGGVALIGGGVIAAVSIAAPPLAIFPCVGGVWMTITGIGEVSS